MKWFIEFSLDGNTYTPYKPHGVRKVKTWDDDTVAFREGNTIAAEKKWKTWRVARVED